MSLLIKEETEQALSGKQDSILNYMPRIYVNDIPTGKPGPLEGRAPGLVPRLSIT